MQVAILACLYVGLRRGDLATAINAAFAMLVAVLPFALELAAGYVLSSSVELGPELALWIALAGFLHALGMLGLYEDTSWWDHLTHVVSAGLIAALIYAALEVAAGPPTSRTGIAAATVGLTFLAGVFWEFVELLAREFGERHGIEPVLIVYGVRDTALDLVFDVLAAVVVVALEVRVFVPLATEFPETARSLLLAGGAVSLLGSASIALGLVVFGGGERRPGD